jgi:hypothetical protein
LLNIEYSSRLINDGRVAVGRVTATDCAYHGSIMYTFEPSPGDPSLRDSPTIQSPACSAAREGDPIRVVYAASGPKAEALSDPREAYAGDLALLGLSLLALLTLASTGFVRELLRSRRSRSGAPPP